MPKKTKYMYGGVGFSSKEEVNLHANALKKRFGSGADIRESASHSFLMDILNGHPEKKRKVGVGVEAFFVSESPDHPTKCFWLRRTDGTETDFGINSCINSIETLNKTSLRAAVFHITDKYKRKTLDKDAESFTSEYSGKTFLIEDAVVNSDPAFEDIVQNFFNSKGIDISGELLTQSIDCNSSPQWKNLELIDAFVAQFSKAKLRLVGRIEASSEIRVKANQARRAARE